MELWEAYEAAFRRMREPAEGELDVPMLKRYIAYARKKCSPRLTEAAMARLQNYYVQIRQVPY